MKDEKDKKDKKDKMISRAYHAATAQNPDFNPRKSDIGDLIPAMQKLLPGVTAEEIRWWRDATDFWQELSSIGNAIQGEGADVVRRQLLGLNEYMCRWFDDHPDVASNIDPLENRAMNAAHSFVQSLLATKVI